MSGLQNINLESGGVRESINVVSPTPVIHILPQPSQQFIKCFFLCQIIISFQDAFKIIINSIISSLMGFCLYCELLYVTK